MIAHLHHCIEQPDLSAQQLSKDQTAYARFSLILTDNVIELMLHRYAEKEMRRDEMWRRIGKPKYSEKERLLVLGRVFDEKVKFANKRGIISKPEERFILICHNYRNELYHQGLVHESVIADIAWHYHDLVCALFARIKSGSYGWSSRDTISDVVKSYCGEKGLTFNPEKQIAVAAEKLSKAKPKRSRTLAKALSLAASRRVEDLDGNIEFLAEDSPTKMTRAEVIFHVQVWPLLSSGKAKGLVKLAPGQKIGGVEDAIQLLRQQWRPPVSNDPVTRWRGRSKALALEKSPIAVLDKYQNLMQQMDTFYEQVYSSAMGLDRHIQYQIDLARGK